jgi:hypothetical protein
MTTPNHRRITVVIHDKLQSQLLLELGARIATQLQAELEVVFVEDAALYRLTGLPFLREVKRDSFTEERLDQARLLKEWRAMANLTRESLKNSATQAGVNWSFRVWRGEIGSELAQLTMESPMLLLGRLAPPIPGRRLTSHPGAYTGPLKLGVIIDNREAADQLLEAIKELSRKPEIQLILFLIPDGIKDSADQLQKQLQESDPQHHNVIVRVPENRSTNLIASLKAAACDLLMLSASSELLQGQDIIRGLSELPYPVVLVR